MMKELAFSIDKDFKELFFPHARIKDKLRIIEILMESCRYILHNEVCNKKEDDCMILVVDKMSRLFFTESRKYYSINFPFTLYSSNDARIISYKGILNIDSKLISDVLAIIKDYRFDSENFLDFADAFVELDDYYLGRIWLLIKDLLSYEDGYLRIDHDPERYLVAKKSNKEHVHPENHIDIFYSNGNTFKLGLTKNVNSNFLIDLLNVRTDCVYLKH